jgi:hypothetical protein
MNKKILVSILAVVILAFVHLAEAQQPKKVQVIGYLASADRAIDVRSEEIRVALRECGYIEGQNIATEYRRLQRR